MFSRSSGYAIQALTYLAAQPSGKLVGAREMATRLEIPMPFLWKILRKLSEKKLVRSFKGVRGGYELARPARAISVSEVLAATDWEMPSGPGIVRRTGSLPAACPVEEPAKADRSAL